MYAVSNVSRYLDCHDKSHWNAVKKILKYLKNTNHYGIHLKKEGSLILVGYSDADYANDIGSRRSTTGYIFMLSGGPVTWCSKRQQSVALSTTEAEYMAASDTTKEAIWLRNLLKDIGVKNSNPTKN